MVSVRSLLSLSLCLTLLSGCPSPPTVNTSNTPPTVTILEPEATDDGTPSVIDTTQPQTLACRVFDLETLPEDLQVVWTILPQDGSGVVEEIGTPRPDSDGTTTMTWNLGERDGAGLLEVEVIDEGLLTARASLEVWFQGEDLPPAVEILSPADGASYPEEEAVEFSAVVTDDRGTGGLTADWQSSLDGLIETTSVAASGVTQFSVDSLSPGFHSITVEVRDSGGQYASDQIDLEIIPPDLPPTPPTVDIQPDPPGTSDDLTCLIVVASSDPEGDTVDYAYDWYRNGEEALSGTNTVVAALTAPDEEWRCVVTPSDRSGNVGPSAEDTVVIGNSEPTMGGVDLRPFDVFETSTIECLPYGYFDPDGDPEGWVYAWFVNTEEVVGATGATLDGASFDEGDAVSCSASPFDGYISGVGEDSDIVTVQNSPPGPPGISLSPAVPTRFDSILCSVSTAAVDPDPADVVNYEFAWTRDGAETGLTDALLPASETELGQTWTCRVRAVDESDASPWVEETVQILPIEGDLILTEFMIDPLEVSDAVGEWFEVYNPGTEEISLAGWVVLDDETDLFETPAAGAPVVYPGEYVVLARGGDPGSNGGVPLDFQYTGLSLEEGPDALVLSLAGVEVDRVEWDETWPIVPGRSLSLDPELTDVLDNDSVASWCSASTPIRSPYSASDLGTPGGVNDGCDCADSDADGDGFGSLPSCTVPDCDDTNPDISPAAIDICEDGIDQDCSGSDDFCDCASTDDDGDGYGDGAACFPVDCNDADASIHPTAAEFCNGTDDDCDGTVDPAGSIGCTDFYLDADGDTWGTTASSCRCAPGEGYTSASSSDCYDGNPYAYPSQSNWFGSQRGDGSFDYNCDGSEDRRWTQMSGECRFFSDICSGDNGWAGGSPPACGETRIWESGCYYSTSGAPWDWGCYFGSRVSVTQECR